MTAAAPKINAWSVPALDVFQERCEARAILVACCELDMQEAVDGLQEAAEAYGLVEALGQDRVQGIIAAAFAKPRRRESSVQSRLRAWLAQHTSQERVAIKRHFEQRK
jgi:hypothetical protein